MKQYEVLIIGAGPGGYKAALALADAGKSVLLVDKAKEKVGGTCLNVGCIPTKNYLESAKFVSKVSYFKDSGVELDVKGLDLKKLQEKTKSLIKEIRTGVLWMLEQAKVDIIYDTAIFVDENTIEIAGEQIVFERCIIAIGSKVRELPALPIDGKKIISSSDIFELEKLPKSVVIMGCGPIGCEFATFFNTFGVDVTMIGRSEQLLPSEDVDVSKALLRVFKRNSIKVFTSTTVKSSEETEDGVKLTLTETNESIECEIVLSAVGRVPNTDGLNLSNAGVEIDDKGFIVVKPSFQTTKEHIYATGDCINTPAFAHTAYAEGEITASNIINNEKQSNTHITPATIFTNPEIASCGLKENEAKEKGIEVDVKKAYFKVNSKAKIHGDDSGFIKMLVCPKSDVILGATIIGVEATEIIHELVIAVERKVTAKELKGLIHAHPTIAEIVSYL